MMKIIKIIKKISANPPHKGAVTHHHDQLIIPINFNVIKIKNIKPKKPTPLEDPESFFPMIKILYCKDMFIFEYSKIYFINLIFLILI